MQVTAVITGALSKCTFCGTSCVPGMESGTVLEVGGVHVVQIHRFQDMKHLPQARPEAGVQTVASLKLVVFAIYGITLSATLSPVCLGLGVSLEGLRCTERLDSHCRGLALSALEDMKDFETWLPPLGFYRVWVKDKLKQVEMM